LWIPTVAGGVFLDEFFDEPSTWYAVTALNELMHQARDGGLYKGRTLARAIFGLLTQQQQKDHPLPNR